MRCASDASRPLRGFDERIQNVLQGGRCKYQHLAGLLR
jgi:hypothetical protein